MAFDIRLHPNAVKFLKGLDEDTRNRIKSALRSLEDEPFKNRSKADIKKNEGHKRAGGFIQAEDRGLQSGLCG